MKIISWNVNGIRAWYKKPGSFEFLEKIEKPDIVCFQETKAQPNQIQELTGNMNGENLFGKNETDGDKIFKDYPFHYWHSAEKKGYSSTGIISKIKPIRVWYGMENSPIENEGRIINAEFEKFILVTVYTPNAKGDLARLPLRYEQWDTAFLEHMLDLEQTKPIVVCGDLNVAHMPIDLARSDANKTTDKKPGGPGFTDMERERFSDFIDAGFIDSFRVLNPTKVQYSWWSYRAGARERNVGWRIDYFLTSQKLLKKIVDTKVYDQVHGSDHCPVGIEISL